MDGCESNGSLHLHCQNPRYTLSMHAKNQEVIQSADARTVHQIAALLNKYSDEGKDISCYLEKLLQEKNLDYTDYLNLDTLLTLQKPRTGQPDEVVFIIYHQVVELFFSLMIWELKQLTSPPQIPVDPLTFSEKIDRLNRYVQILIASFQVILDGLDKEQFQKFRVTLFPASGFQSCQYRLIEFYITDLKNLVAVRSRGEVLPDADLRFLYDRLYWKIGMTNPRKGDRSPTLTDFEDRYDGILFNHAAAHKSRNLWQVFKHQLAGDPTAPEIVNGLRQLDESMNVRWQSLHYKVAMKYLTTDENTQIQSTGGSHWRKYLHPHFQKIIFFPALWTESEMADWGAQEYWKTQQDYTAG